MGDYAEEHLDQIADDSGDYADEHLAKISDDSEEPQEESDYSYF